MAEPERLPDFESSDAPGRASEGGDAPSAPPRGIERDVDADAMGIVRTGGAGTKSSPRERPDWLVGAEEGVAAENARTDDEPNSPSRTILRPKLFRAGEEVQQGEAGAAGPATPAAPPPKAWVAAASSVPTLRPRSPMYMPPPRSYDEEENRDPATPGGFPDDDVAEKATATALPPLREAWWVVALDEVRTNLKIQIVLGCIVVGMVAVAMWPKSEPSVSLHNIRQHPSEWDGRTVMLHGRVGEVFPVGGGFTYYLHQGRDTIVVFTRANAPKERDHVDVRGSISTGYMDGVARQALFAD